MMARRWGKLEKDFKPRQTERQAENGIFDISKIPDIYDCIKYDTLHNSHLPLPNKNELYAASKALADVIVPQVIIACISFKTKKEWEYFPIPYFWRGIKKSPKTNFPLKKIDFYNSAHIFNLKKKLFIQHSVFVTKVANCSQSSMYECLVYWC